MIKRLKYKFVVLSMTSLFILLCVIVAGMNIVNYHSVVSEADSVLSILTAHKGGFPVLENGMDFRIPPNMSPELPFESRYFSVLADENGEIIRTETSRITAVDESQAVYYANKALKLNKTKGFIENFRFSYNLESQGVRITFLDCGRKLDSFKNFLLASCVMSLLGFIIVFFVICFFAGRIIRPIAESYEKQRRFITDAGHEIKTPLTIINANVDVLEMELGSNECLEDIQLQTKRLTSLTNDLVMLSRMEESENSMQMIEFPLSDVVYDTASSFKALASSQNKNLTLNIEKMLSFSGNGKAIEQLISILLDNALKYSPENSTITLNLSKQLKYIYLTVHNITKSEIDTNKLNLIFDRFYRTDASRNSETGGHGIGLSIAKAIITAHSGKIFASSLDSHSFQITVILPI